MADTLDAFGRIDVLVNNAGHGMMGAIEEVSDAEARLVFGSNVFGLLNVTRAALPSMRQRRSGHIVLIGSVGGLRARRGSGMYCATKFAVEAIGEALAEEVAPLGIGVTVIEPGPIRTDFMGRSLLEVAKPIEDYADTAGQRGKALKGSHGTQPGDPDKVAKAIIEVVDSPEPSLRFVIGSEAMALAQNKLADVQSDIERWRALSAATDFD